MIEVRHPKRPEFTAPDKEDFWGILILGSMVSCFVFGLLGAVVMDAIYFGGPGMDRGESISGAEITSMVVGAPLIYATLYCLAVFLGPRVWPSTYVYTIAQRNEVHQRRTQPKAVQQKSQAAYDTWMLLREDDPQYIEAKHLYNETVAAATQQEKLIARRKIDLTGVKDNLESLQSSNKHFEEWDTHDA